MQGLKLMSVTLNHSEQMLRIRANKYIFEYLIKEYGIL